MAAFASHQVVHPMDVQVAAAPVNLPPGVLAKDLPGMPGTPGALFLNVMQLLFAGMSLWFLFHSGSFRTTKGFWFLAASDLFLCVWSLAMAVLGIYSLLVVRSFRNPRAVALFAIGDAVAWLVIFTGASAAAGVSYYIEIDVNVCSYKNNRCGPFKAAISLAFCSLFSLSPSCLLNLYSFASIRA